MKSSRDRTWSVGDVAERFGLPTNVLRHWESVGLLEPARDTAGRRRYVRDDIARVAAIQRNIERLPNGAHVLLGLEDGSEVTGIVAARPIAQMFFGPDGREGMNAVVRIEQPALDHPESAGWRDLWVDRIREVRRLDPE